VNTPTTLDLAMAVSATGEVVNVASEISQVNTTDASMGNPFSEMQVRQIPLQTRNVVELLSVQPGVTSNGEVLGARRDQNNVTLDGADVNNNQNSGWRRRRRQPAWADTRDQTPMVQISIPVLMRCCQFLWIPSRNSA